MGSINKIEDLKVNQPEEVTYNDYILKEQSKDQDGKCHERLIDEYSDLIFPMRWRKKTNTVEERKPQVDDESFKTEKNKSEIDKLLDDLLNSEPRPEPNPIQDFVDQYCGPEVSNVEALLNRINLLRGRPITWVEMGGGRGLVMRQIGRLPEMKEKVSMFNVDLFDYDLKDVSDKDMEYLETKFPGVTSSYAKPALINANSETVILPQKADIITSIEGIQYLNNPLAAICNWYNQLADYGLLIIATEHKWSEWIRNEGHVYTSDPTPIDPFLSTLKTQKIAFEIDDYPDRNPKRNSEIRILMIEKKPNTSMILRDPIKKIWKNYYDYKAIYYEKRTEPIEIVEANSQEISKKMDYKQMNKVTSKMEK
jgi:SAM-dependent methyltransferase